MPNLSCKFLGFISVIWVSLFLAYSSGVAVQLLEMPAKLADNASMEEQVPKLSHIEKDVQDYYSPSVPLAERLEPEFLRHSRNVREKLVDVARARVTSQAEGISIDPEFEETKIKQALESCTRVLKSLKLKNDSSESNGRLFIDKTKESAEKFVYDSLTHIDEDKLVDPLVIKKSFESDVIFELLTNKILTDFKVRLNDLKTGPLKKEYFLVHKNMKDLPKLLSNFLNSLEGKQWDLFLGYFFRQELNRLSTLDEDDHFRLIANAFQDPEIYANLKNKSGKKIEAAKNELISYFDSPPEKDLPEKMAKMALKTKESQETLKKYEIYLGEYKLVHRILASLTKDPSSQFSKAFEGASPSGAWKLSILNGIEQLFADLKTTHVENYPILLQEAEQSFVHEIFEAEFGMEDESKYLWLQNRLVSHITKDLDLAIDSAKLKFEALMESRIKKLKPVRRVQIQKPLGKSRLSQPLPKTPTFKNLVPSVVS